MYKNTLQPISASPGRNHPKTYPTHHPQTKMAQVELNQSLFAEAKDKTVLITGAARGIGAATATLFNAKGANVILADLSQFRTEAEEVIRTQLAHPDRAAFFPANIVDWTELTECFEKTIARFGGLDIAVANAGIMESRPVLDLDAVDGDGRLLESEEAGRVIDVNLKGTLNSIFCPFLLLILFIPSLLLPPFKANKINHL